MNDVAFANSLMAARPALVRYARSLCFDADRSEDLASETVAKGFAARASFIPGTNLRAWLTTILRNVFLTEQRRKRFDGGSIEDLGEFVIPVAATQEGHVHLRDAIDALAIIDPDQRDAVIAVALGNEYEEVAESMGVCVGTIKSRVGRGRKALQEISA